MNIILKTLIETEIDNPSTILIKRKFLRITYLFIIISINGIIFISYANKEIIAF